MKAHDFCKKFQHSIVFVIELLMYILTCAVFFLLFSIDNPEIINLSRTAAVTLSTYAIMLVLLTIIYGKFDVGKRKSGQISLSICLATIFTDLITYFELSIMKTNEANNQTFKLENIGILVLVILIQILIIVLFTHLGESFFFYVNPKEKCLIVTGSPDDSKRVASALSDFKKRYEVGEIISYEDPALEEKMIENDTVVLYDVPVLERTQIVDFCYQNLKNIYFNPHIADILEQNAHPVIIDDISFFSTRFHMITFEERLVKKFIDVFVSLLALIIMSPILLISAVLIKKEDGGKVFFKQKRATVHGRVF